MHKKAHLIRYLSIFYSNIYYHLLLKRCILLIKKYIKNNFYWENIRQLFLKVAYFIRPALFNKAVLEGFFPLNLI
jgi:hypothetical protein